MLPGLGVGGEGPASGLHADTQWTCVVLVLTYVLGKGGIMRQSIGK